LAKLFKLLLIGFLLVLSSDLCLHDVLSSNQAVIHSLDIKKFTLQPDVGFFIRVLDFLGFLSNLFLDIFILRVGQGSL